MTTQQGSLELLNEEVAQELLRSKIPARLAYNWTDGTPRVIPIGFHWNGKEIVICGPLDAPKMKALKNGAHVALTIDSNAMPYRVLLIRGTVRVDEVAGIPAEYEATCIRMDGEEAAKEWLSMCAAMWSRMARIVITPTWVGTMDFESRFPSAVERGIGRMQAVST